MRKNRANKLFREMPFLVNITAEDDDLPERPVSIEPGKMLPTSVSLEYGRYNDYVTTSYTSGITGIFCVSADNVVFHRISEGTTQIPATWLDVDFVVTRHEYRSMLVYCDPGEVTYTVYKQDSISAARAAIEAEESENAKDFLSRL